MSSTPPKAAHGQLPMPKTGTRLPSILGRKGREDEDEDAAPMPKTGTSLRQRRPRHEVGDAGARERAQGCARGGGAHEKMARTNIIGSCSVRKESWYAITE